MRFLSLERLLGPVPSLELSPIDWMIVGGESGPAHRALDLTWVRDIRDRCVDLRVASGRQRVGGAGQTATQWSSRPPRVRTSPSTRPGRVRRGRTAGRRRWGVGGGCG
ncbi:DUF5131 family protein [Streptomyces bottropensis]|uniref:DUF5131 family protein n=1 Tax=Streptomyces bottropensis TaxID=42235 RepID=UPI003689EB91